MAKKGGTTNSGTKQVQPGSKIKVGGPKTGLQHTTNWPKLGGKGK